MHSIKRTRESATMAPKALRSSARRSKEDMQVDNAGEPGVESSGRASSSQGSTSELPMNMGDGDDEHALQKGPKAACVGCRNISKCPSST